MDTFCKALVDEDLNPWEVDVDLETEFIKRNWATLQEQAVAKAITAEQQRSAKANTQSATTTKGVGGAHDPGDAKINTVDDLTKFLNSQS